MASSILPTDSFSLLVDPECLTDLRASSNYGVLHLLEDLRTCEHPVKITLLIPNFRGNSSAGEAFTDLNLPVKILKGPSKSPRFTPDHYIDEDVRRSLLQGRESDYLISLLSLAEYHRVDGVITTSPTLIQARYPLHQHHLIRVIPLEDLADTIEICAHGHSIFWSARDPNRSLTPDIFYPWTHWKDSRYAKWFFSIQPRLLNSTLDENLRTSLVIRYPFILYARDMTRFYELQMDYYTRRGLSRRFFLPLGYHVNCFYLQLWGMLDQLTILAKHARALAVPERQCGIRSKEFWKEFQSIEQELAKFVASDPIAAWIDIMADMRHRAAHKVIPMPTEVLEATEDSKRSDDEIWEILKREDPDLVAFLPQTLVNTFKPQMVFHWRISKMKRVMQNVVMFEGKQGEYVRSPVLSIDFDLMYLNAVTDAFLIKLFTGPHSLKLFKSTDPQ